MSQLTAIAPASATAPLVQLVGLDGSPIEPAAPRSAPFVWFVRLVHQSRSLLMGTSHLTAATADAILDGIIAEAIRELIAATPTPTEGRVAACQVLIDAIEDEVSLNAATADAEREGLDRVAALRERVAPFLGE